MRFGHHGNIRALSSDSVHRHLEAHRERYYKDGSMELLHAVQYCAEENVPMPMWFAIAFDVYAFKTALYMAGGRERRER